jgi:cellulose synthase (UDP-forming)
VMPGVDALAAAEPAAARIRPAAGTGAGKPMFNFGVYDPERKMISDSNLSVEHVFLDWAAPDADKRLADAIGSAGISGRWLLLTLEPWTRPGLTRGRLLNDVEAGRYDDRIDLLCGQIGRKDQIGKGKIGVFIRWGHEMEQKSSRYPWQSHDEKAYINAYRHFVNRCRSRIRERGDIYFVWSPVGNSSLSHYYPGSEYVDWIGLSAYSCTGCRTAGRASVESFADLVRPKYRRVRAYGKPVMVAEMGNDAGDDAQFSWLKAALKESCALPHLRLLVYFDAVDSPGVWGSYQPDWRLKPRTRAAVSSANAKTMCGARG